MIYLDYAAATPLDKQVLRAMEPYLGDRFFNPSATYLPAKKVNDELSQARASVAHWLGARPNEIVFTAGGTEANNLAIKGVLTVFPNGQVVTSAIEHDSVLAPLNHYPHTRVSVSPDGLININDLANAITDQTVLVSVIYANNEVGTVQPLHRISQVISAVRSERVKKGIKLPIYFHSDGAQAGNYLDLHVSRLGVDLLSLNGGKIYGPKQSGVLYVSSKVQIKPLIEGGGQEYGLRSGTQNVAGNIGMAKALDIAQTIRSDESYRLAQLQKQFIVGLTKRFKAVVINGSLKHRLPNNLHFSLPEQDNERLLMQLEQHSIYGAAGSACSAANTESSHVLLAMGISDQMARASLRLTMGRQTTKTDMQKVLAQLSALVA